MKKIKTKYEVVINHEIILSVKDLKEAERKVRRGNEFDENHIIRKDYDEKGNLLESWLIG